MLRQAFVVTYKLLFCMRLTLINMFSVPASLACLSESLLRTCDTACMCACQYVRVYACEYLCVYACEYVRVSACELLNIGVL